MRRNRRGGGFHQEFGGSGEDSFVAVVVTKLTGALLFILLLTMVIMALIPKADQVVADSREQASAKSPKLVLEVPRTLPEALLGRRYEYAFSVRGESTDPLTWSIREPLPEGLTFDAKAGRLIGSVRDSDAESLSLTIQVTDGRSVAGAETTLPVWDPGKSVVSPVVVDRKGGRNPELDAWLSQGFGLVLIWFGHIAGMGVVGRMQEKNLEIPDEPSKAARRFVAYRIAIRLMSFGLTGVLVYWLVTSG